ncbi:xanthine dehydrogenase family protein molybdopterin-binding subunit [Thiorhodococcus mannitoliphagus]|uniref:Xanthine dehydrogenase family protein molybdopterin-binding subunit n=1 Tax=Thiorhodococcus mannitoliphagus TaxID=329406 RepID=A0A6P1DTS4_9GAMM|nr:xanthine dehydrogenase family protein molybdopterin-binding subunit [Thiorhodococcus mannitoliphagus]NEX20850.1 xanthine dehydrogenase family protein molybdopterin-binding subunit [Thiorhodococcus mannitoliphagus]
MRNQITNLSRRGFLQQGLAAGAGLTLGAHLGGFSRLLEAAPAADGATAALEPNAFVRIGTDDSVTVIVKHLEMGQGTYTGLPTLVAEELDARWDQVRVEGAPADASRYNNLFWGPTQGTGGSTSMANSWQQMREAGAVARQMLIEAAAKRWQVDAQEIQVRDGQLSHASGQRASFGELAEAAAELPVPESVFVKDPKEFRLIGDATLRRKDTADKIDGSARYTQDVSLPGLLTAVVAHPPRFGARLKSFDPGPAMAIKGVEKVVQIPSGVAVLAGDFWTAKRGRDRLRLEWDESDAFKLSSDAILEHYKTLVEAPGAVAAVQGDAEAALASADKVVEGDFAVPFLAHAAMEPLNCVILPDADGVRVINGEQSQTRTQAGVAAVLGLRPEQVRIDMLYAGSSFGRRGNPKADFTSEAAEIFKAAGGKTAVKLQWTREDDTRAGWYRPLFFHRVRAGLDADGRPVAWHHRIVGQSIAVDAGMEARMVVDGVDRLSVEGAANLAYGVPNLYVDLHSPKLPVPIQWWRSVGHTHTAFAVECIIDELAAAAGRDPVDYRMELLDGHPRHQGVLKLAAEKAGWGTPLPEGRARGVAVHASFNSYVAQVAEVRVRGKAFRVDRVVIAVDCGMAVNPDVIKAQMEGGMGYGLAAALVSSLTLKDGRVEQSNFHDYQVLRMDQMPEVEVHIVPSAEAPTGVGEPATPVIAPAVANALAAATGQRLRTLPLKLA